MTSLKIIGDATMRYEGLLSGLRPLARQSSLPVSGSWPVTQSPPVITISVFLPYRSRPGVVYESGDSRMALVGRSIFHNVLPVFLSMRITYEGSSVFIP